MKGHTTVARTTNNDARTPARAFLKERRGKGAGPKVDGNDSSIAGRLGNNFSDIVAVLGLGKDSGDVAATSAFGAHGGNTPGVLAFKGEVGGRACDVLGGSKTGHDGDGSNEGLRSVHFDLYCGCWRKMFAISFAFHSDGGTESACGIHGDFIPQPFVYPPAILVALESR
jgi:hypothetical protein